MVGFPPVIALALSVPYVPSTVFIPAHQQDVTHFYTRKKGNKKK